MSIKMLVSDPDCDGLELEAIRNDIRMNFLGQFIQDTQDLLLIIHVLLEGGVSADWFRLIFFYYLTVIETFGKLV